MSPFRYRDDDSSTGAAIASAVIGAVAGFAVGMYVAQRVGGFGGLTARIRRKGEELTTGHLQELGEEHDEIEPDDTDEFDEAYAGALDEDELEDEMDELADEDVPLLEERVLEAFNNDPVLAERAIDIGTIGEGVIELAGWVDTEDEAEHAVTVAGGVPGVETVVNRLLIGDEERQLGENAKRVREGDPALTESRWEGQQVGTGRRRQGTSAERDRHADPKPVLEDRWLDEDEALKNAADDISTSEPRRTRGRAPKGDRTGGSADAPTGVPKADHVAEP